MKAIVTLDVEPFVCLGCGAEEMPIVYEARRDSASGELRVVGRAPPPGWDALYFGSTQGHVCPVCGSHVAKVLIEKLHELRRESGHSDPQFRRVVPDGGMPDE